MCTCTEISWYPINMYKFCFYGSLKINLNKGKMITHVVFLFLSKGLTLELRLSLHHFTAQGNLKLTTVILPSLPGCLMPKLVPVSHIAFFCPVDQCLIHQACCCHCNCLSTIRKHVLYPQILHLPTKVMWMVVILGNNLFSDKENKTFAQWTITQMLKTVTS